MDGVGLVRGCLRPGRRAVGAGLPRLRQRRPIRRRRVPLLRAAGPVADADDVADDGTHVHADDAGADQRAFHGRSVAWTVVQAHAPAVAAADASALRGTYAVADAGADTAALSSADVRAQRTTDAAAQSPANAGAVASARSGANGEADARTHGYAWKSDCGSGLLPYAAAIACTDAAAHAGAVRGTVAGADARTV